MLSKRPCRRTVSDRKWYRRTGLLILNQKKTNQNIIHESRIEPEDSVEKLLENRRKELQESEFFDRRDPTRISHLTKLKILKEILELIYDSAKEQRKVTEKLEVDVA